MPHKVTSFFRASTSSFENQVSNLKKKTATGTQRRDSPSRSTGRNSRSSERVFSYASSLDEDREDSPPPTKMNESAVGEQHHHRLSFPALHIGRSKEKEREAHSSSNAAVILDWEFESPPAIYYGDAESSTGALVSGQLWLDVRQDMLDVESFGAVMNIHVTQKRPFANHCHDCQHQYTELKKWEFLGQKTLAKGKHQYPFSIHLEGHLPASTDGPLVSISYEFKAELVRRGQGLAPIKLEKTLDVKRSLQPSETPHHSVRIFPPTNIKANVHYPQIIYPSGGNTLMLKLDGIAKHNVKPDTIEYWKLKKLTWRLEETSKTVAPACEKHKPKDAGASAEAKKGLQRTDVRTLGERTMYNGWKSNYSSATDSMVELELDYALTKGMYVCDMKAHDGSEVSHQLMIEMVVSQEWAPVNKPQIVTQTGVGRILRMHFGTVITERGGIGISWDNEAPPIYQDVPPSPPSYCEETDLDEHIETQPLDGVDAPPPWTSTA